MKRARTARAVVADDDEDCRERLVSMLRSQGFEVTEAGDGNELTTCVAALVQAGDPPRVVVSDIGMPACDGIEATRRLRRFSATLPVVLVTGYTDTATWSQGYGAGASEILNKPVSVSALHDALRRLLVVHA
jgi:CheY-like chemotaxis protein